MAHVGNVYINGRKLKTDKDRSTDLQAKVKRLTEENRMLRHDKGVLLEALRRLGAR